MGIKMKRLLIGVLFLESLALSSFAHENGTIKIYDASLIPQIISLFREGKLVLEDGKRQSIRPVKKAKTLHKNLEVIRDFYADNFGLKSWDGKGADIKASININTLTIFDVLGMKQNAAWAQTRFMFGAGKRKGLDDFEKALDVVAHEYTHAVIQESSKLKYEGQSGALNEHFADVFGSIINQIQNPNLANPYLIGASILNGEYAEKFEALRDMMDPAKGLSPQPAHMKDLKLSQFSKYVNNCTPSSDNDRCGVHVLSGIPNKVSALIMSVIGPQASAKLFYNVMTKHMKENSQFKDYKKALLLECKNMASDTCDIVDNSLKSVGL